MKRLYILLTILCIASCRHADIDETLLLKEDISLTVKGEEMMKYNEKSCQLGYNSSTNEFRVYDDKLGNMFILTCNARPSTEGQVIKADLTWTGASSTKKRSGLNFTVKKTSPDGLIWLWCDSDRIGIIVKELS